MYLQIIFSHRTSDTKSVNYLATASSTEVNDTYA